MTADQPAVSVDQVLLTHLETADLPADAQELVLAAVLGEDELSNALGSAAPARPAAGPVDHGSPATAYLSRIEVRGFRGIGEKAALELVPGPGLTVVTGRNGSGKSSFAEAAELALTGDNRRWAGRGQVWRDGWRNLHVAGDRFIKVGLTLDGHRGGAAVECQWPDGAGLDRQTTFLQRAGEQRRDVADLGWERPMQLFRPFLSYSELGDLLGGRPSEMYDSLHSVLGLGRLVEVERRLKAARSDSDRARNASQEELPALREALAGHPDPRARQAERMLAEPTVDLDGLEQLASEVEPAGGGAVETWRALATVPLPSREPVALQLEQVRLARQAIAELAATPAARARTVAGLLRDALRYHGRHPDLPCPVCAGRSLDAQWARQARVELDRLTGQAEQLEQAHRTLRAAWQRLRELVPPTPPVLRSDPDTSGLDVDITTARDCWLAWDELLRQEGPSPDPDEVLDRFDAVVAAMAPVRAAAEAALRDRQRAWQPVAAQVGAWVETERRSRHAARVHTAARRAVAWLRTVGEQIRNEQLAPLAGEAAEIWHLLRQDSNVDIGAVRLAGTGNRRKVDLDVAVDGESGAALGVMSQGELHALALSLFLPRATAPASPFRFLVIDDPVQSMDPAKVYGLARVLARVAATRQVIVFTHDDRLPAAVRQLGINARLQVVSRQEHSQVRVQLDEQGDPARRYLADAWAVTRDDQVDLQLRTKVVCVLVRDAIEARCHDLVRGQQLRAGRPVATVEEQLAQATGLRPVLALALLGDAGRGGETHASLRKLHPRAGRVVDEVNRGVHGEPVRIPLPVLVEDARQLVARMVAR